MHAYIDHVCMHVGKYIARRPGKHRKQSRPGQGIGDKETREAYRRLGMHSRLGKVRRLRKPIGDQEDMKHAGK